MEIKEYKTWVYSRLLKANRTKTELAKAMGITETYDTTIPQQWLRIFVKNHGFEYRQVIYSCFMVYTPQDYWGTMYSAWNKCQQAINLDRIDWIKDVLADRYSEMIKEDLKRLCGIDVEQVPGEFSSAMIKMMQP